MAQHLLNLIVFWIQPFVWARSIFSMVVYVLPWHCVKQCSWRFLCAEKHHPISLTFRFVPGVASSPLGCRFEYMFVLIRSLFDSSMALVPRMISISFGCLGTQNASTSLQLHFVPLLISHWVRFDCSSMRPRSQFGFNSSSLQLYFEPRSITLWFPLDYI